jgi:hypothetical protein
MIFFVLLKFIVDFSFVILISLVSIYT